MIKRPEPGFTKNKLKQDVGKTSGTFKSSGNGKRRTMILLQVAGNLLNVLIEKILLLAYYKTKSLLAYSPRLGVR